MLPSIYNLDTIPMAVDAGFAQVIQQLSYEGLRQDDFMARLDNSFIRLPWKSILQIISDLHACGELLDVQTDGELPPPVLRPQAPSGIGGTIAGGGLWFSSPMAGTYRVRAYVDGGLRWISDPMDLGSNRSIPVSALGEVGPGQILQLALVDLESGAVGWWGRTTLA